ncbi:MAG: RHS repeat protein [Verrucomicrobiaceae bacterium]|nr:RHS repeat protein [Verrucomicrobiaceae bacterium]
MLSVTEPTNSAANVSYTYDELGRVLSETSRGITYNYVYDIAGNRVRADYGTGRSVQTSYDALNRPESIAESERATRYGYDLGGRAVILMAGNGQVTSNSYDALGRLKERTLFRTQGMTEGDALGDEPGTWVTLFGASYALEHHPYPGTEIEICHPGQQRQVLHHVVVDDHIEAAGGHGQRLVKVCAQVLVLAGMLDALAARIPVQLSTAPSGVKYSNQPRSQPRRAPAAACPDAGPPPRWPAPPTSSAARGSSRQIPANDLSGCRPRQARGRPSLLSG